jgi:hypothetical protein
LASQARTYLNIRRWPTSQEADQGAEYTQPSGNLTAAPIHDAFLGTRLTKRQMLSGFGEQHKGLEPAPLAL